MQGMQVAAEPLSAPPYATECAMTLDGTPACDSQFENNPGHPHATVNKKIVLDNRVRQ